MIHESTCQLCNTKRPEIPEKVTKMDDRRILSMVKKNPITLSSQEQSQRGRCIIVRSTMKRPTCV